MSTLRRSNRILLLCIISLVMALSSLTAPLSSFAQGEQGSSLEVTSEQGTTSSSSLQENADNEVQPTGAMVAPTASNGSPEDIIDLVNEDGVVIYARASDGTWTNAITDENGQLLNPAYPPTLLVGQGLMFKAKWSIDDVQGKGLVDGDWFEFNLPSNYFSFDATVPINLVAYNEDTLTQEIIGTHQVIAAANGQPAKIRITLNDLAAQKSFIKNGFVSVNGTAHEVKGNEEEIKFGDIILPEISIEPADPNAGFPDLGNISKSGWQTTQQGVVFFQLNVNMRDVRSVFDGDIVTPEAKNNLYLIDELPEGLKLGSSSNIDLVFPLFAANASGKMSQTLINGGWNNGSISSQFTKIPQYPGETWADFQTRVKGAAAPAYGICEDASDNRTKLIFNFGTLPSTGGLTNFKTLDQVKDLIDADTSLSASVKQYTKDAYDRIYAASNNTGVIGAYIHLQAVEVTEEKEEYENIARLQWTDTEESAGTVVKYQKQEGGATTGDPQSVTIRKFEQGTNLPLSGALFKLQVKDAFGVYSDFSPHDGGAAERPTVNGCVVFKSLPYGEYKVVEVQPPSGYDADKITFLNDIDTFTIDGTEQGTLFITAYNVPLQTSLRVTKVWDDHNDQDRIRPESITVQLKADGIDHGTPVTLDAAHDWQYQWTNLPQYDNGTPIDYTIEEIDIPAGYTVSVDESDKADVVITNSHVPTIPAVPITPSTPTVLAKTGDSLDISSLAGLTILSIVVLGMSYSLCTRQNRKQDSHSSDAPRD